MKPRPPWITTQPTRAARANICRHCHAPIIEGLDSDTAALEARADPDPINETGELLALAAGRATYNLVRLGARRVELDRRDQWRIRTRRYDVLAEHACGAAPLPQAPLRPARPRPAAPTEVPF